VNTCPNYVATPDFYEEVYQLAMAVHAHHPNAAISGLSGSKCSPSKFSSALLKHVTKHHVVDILP
jgi:hypothetical protein